MEKKCSVIIPIYKAIPSKEETASFIQCLKILNKYDIYICTFESLSLSIYKKLTKLCNKKCNVEYFNEKYFNSIIGYNSLCLDKKFYIRFEKYEYMLIYQLDAWVFRDELEYWCNQDYDYIGAPWFKIDKNKNYTLEFDGVGNGGFSLRKISYCLRLLDFPQNEPLIGNKDLIKNIHSPLDLLKYFLKIFRRKNNLSFYINKNTYEDLIFSKLAKPSKLKPNIPKESIASKFAYEINPSYLYKMNNYKLPFGCHAFKKYEFETFWKKHISIQTK